jgi:hypothetical protein
MAFATFRVTVYGDLYSEILENAEEEICSLLEISEEEFQGKVQYELIIEKEEEFDSEFTYKAEVIARIK